MSDNELKNIANALSDAFIQSEKNFTKMFDYVKNKIKTMREGYIIGKLCDIYYQAKTGGITKKKAVIMQEQIFFEGNALI